MKLLIVTQTVDSADSNLGFFIQWIREFANLCERVEVISLRQGTANTGSNRLPDNVNVHPLGAGSTFARAWRFLKLIWQSRRDYDAVFVHMNPEYIVLGGLFWRIWGKKIGLWYAHKSVTLKLRIAMLFADYIFTVSNDSFRIATQKKRVMGHGIDTMRFPYLLHTVQDVLHLVMVGRISASKHLLEVLPVLDELAAQKKAFSLAIIGAPLTMLDQEYQTRLKSEIAKRPYAASIHLIGAVNHHELLTRMANADVALNFATTGNMDKTGLEALAAGMPLVTTNTAFKALMGVKGIFFEEGGPRAVARAITRAAGTDTIEAAEHVREHHSLSQLIPAILDAMQNP